MTSTRPRPERARAQAGAPRAVPPSATKPLVIPKPGTQEFDDQRTVLYRRDEPSWQRM